MNKLIPLSSRVFSLVSEGIPQTVDMIQSSREMHRHIIRNCRRYLHCLVQVLQLIYSVIGSTPSRRRTLAMHRSSPHLAG